MSKESSQSGPEEGGSQDNGKPSALESIIALLLKDGLFLFPDQLGEAYAAVGKNGASVIRLDSHEFEEWLYNLIWEKYQRSTSDGIIKAVIKITKHRASLNPPINLGVRVASNNGAIYYDLGRIASIEMTPAGWRTIYKSLPIVFKRFDHQEEQTLPDSSQRSDIDELLELFNVHDEKEKLLLKIYLVAAFIPDFPHPVLVIHGSQGSAKSTLCKLIKSLVDPSRADSLCITDDRDIKELVQTASHHWVLVLDNLSYLSEKISDTLSRICTGGSLSKRRLWTNSDDFIFNVRHLVVLNGVSQIINKPDLLDRSIIIGLDRIPDEKRMTEKEVWERFNALKPKVLGWIFDTVSRAMREQSKVQQKNLSRMADFSRCGCAIAIAIGRKAEDFMDAYTENIGRQNQEAIGASPVATVIIEYMADKPSVEMTPSELLGELDLIATQMKLSEDKRFPTTASWLWRRIADVIPNLAAAGIRAEQDKNNQRKIRLTKIITIQDSNVDADKMPAESKTLLKGTEDSTDGIDSISSLGAFDNNEGKSSEEF